MLPVYGAEVRFLCAPILVRLVTIKLEVMNAVFGIDMMELLCSGVVSVVWLDSDSVVIIGEKLVGLFDVILLEEIEFNKVASVESDSKEVNVFVIVLVD